ncbi:MAG TPA: Wzz/FepE/Etk N-terminal domain-containing protein, partial [Thermomonospora sp.]|nr:Wzz/FepE/Etk N-terminal domain-containing protein [Thermomonospora sp.]
MASSPPPSKEFADYSGLVRRRWRLIAGCAAGVLALVAGYTFTLAEEYTASAQVLVTSTGFDDLPQVLGSKSTSNVNLDTEAQVAKSLEVTQEAKRLLKYGGSEDQLLSHVTVSVPPNSGVLNISYTDGDPRTAANGANIFAQAYLNRRTASAQANLKAQITVISTKIEELRKRSKISLDRIGRLRGAARTYEEAQQRVMSRQITDMTGRLDTLNTTTITPGRVISAATVPTSPSGPNVPLYLTGGLMLGLLIGVGAAMPRDRFDTRVRSGGDVERLLDLPVLLELRRPKGAPRLGLLPARSRSGQEVHELGHQITATLGHGHHVVLVSSATEGPGAGLAAANLAAALARTESRVVLVCADLHSAESARLTEVQPGIGLAEVLLRRKTLRDVAARSGAQNRLWVIQPGQETDLAYEQLQTKLMVSVVEQLRKIANYVVIDAPPTKSSADAQAIAEAADAALVVVEVPVATREDVDEAARALDRMGVAVLGTIVVPHQAPTPASAVVPQRPLRVREQD